MNKFLSGAKQIIVSSENLIRDSKVLQQFKEKCRVIPFGIDANYLKATPAQEELKIKIQKKFGENNILFIGRLVKYKGLNHLISAMTEVSGNLLIIGGGPERLPLEKLVAQLGLSDKVHFIGFVPEEEIGAYCLASKAMALTSINESEAFGMSLLDGLAMGLPLLTTSLPTGVNIVNIDGQTGYQVPVGDVKAISRQLNTLLKDDSLRARLGASGKLHFQKNFQLTTMVQAHMDLYRKILAK